MKLLAIIVALLIASVGIVMAQPPTTFHFTGMEFKDGAGQGVASLVAPEGFLPSRGGEDTPAPAAKLPAGSGGLALLCYVQTSGGKAEGRPGYQPLAGVPIEIYGKNLKLMARTNDSGYLFLALPAGQYEIKFSAFSKKIRIDKGKNTLAALRGGKRMVD